MPRSSTIAAYNGSLGTVHSSDLVQPRATDSHTTSHSIAINRFISDPDQRRPLEFTAIQSAAEAEAAETAKIAAQLHAFEQQFGSHSEPPTQAQTN